MSRESTPFVCPRCRERTVSLGTERGRTVEGCPHCGWVGSDDGGLLRAAAGKGRGGNGGTNSPNHS